MKNRFHVKIYIIGLFLFISLIFPYFLPQNITDYDNPSNPQPSSIGDYEEEDFTPIYLNSAEINYGRKVIGTSQTFLECNITFTYPSSGDKWKLILPEEFSDARDYKIQRSPIEIFYTVQDEELITQRYIGENSYWIIDSEEGLEEVLQFSLLLPTANFNVDFSRDRMDQRVWQIRISRFELVNRPYEDVIFRHEIRDRYNTHSFQFFNRTGGLNVNITDTIDFSYYIDERVMGDAIVFELNLGYIQNRTEYLFDIFHIRGVEPITFTSDLFGNVIYPFVGGVVIAIPLHPYIVRSVLKKPLYRGTKTKDVLKYGLPLGAILGIIWIGISYILFTTRGF